VKLRDKKSGAAREGTPESNHIYNIQYIINRVKWVEVEGWGSRV